MSKQIRLTVTVPDDFTVLNGPEYVEEAISERLAELNGDQQPFDSAPDRYNTAIHPDDVWES